MSVQSECKQFLQVSNAEAKIMELLDCSWKDSKLVLPKRLYIVNDSSCRDLSLQRITWIHIK